MAEVSASATEQAAQVPASAESGSPATDDALVAGELLVEEISIDGMCGVY
jgi:mycofactocin precursor